MTKLQTLSEKEELLFTVICKEWAGTDSHEEFLNILQNWKCPIHGSVKGKRKEAVEINVVNSGLYEIKTKLNKNKKDYIINRDNWAGHGINKYGTMQKCIGLQSFSWEDLKERDL